EEHGGPVRPRPRARAGDPGRSLPPPRDDADGEPLRRRPPRHRGGARDARALRRGAASRRPRALAHPAAQHRAAGAGAHGRVPEGDGGRALTTAGAKPPAEPGAPAKSAWARRLPTFHAWLLAARRGAGMVRAGATRAAVLALPASIAGSVILAYHARFLQDDAYISFRYAKHL